MFRSIQWRIAIPFMLLIVGSMGILGFCLVNFVRDTQTDDLYSYLENEAKLVAEAALPGFLDADKQDRLDVLADTLGNRIDARVTIIARDGTVLGDSEEDPSNMENHATRPEVVNALALGVGESTHYSVTLDQRMMYVAVQVSSHDEVVGVARVALPLTAVESSVNQVTATIAVATALAALLAILCAWLIARGATRPIRELTEASRRIASGELSQRIVVRTHDEVGELAHAFNEMSFSLREMVRRISEERSKLANVLASITDGVVLVDVEQNIMLANPAAERLFSFQEDKVTGRPLVQVIQDYEVAEVLKLCLEQKQEQTVQIEFGAARQFLSVIAVPLVANGGLTGALLLFQDLTELRSFQTMRQEFVGNILHDLRTPLTSIKAIVETLQDGAMDDEGVSSDFLSKIDTELDRMTQMAEELGALSRIETGQAKLKLESVNVNLVVEEALARLKLPAEKQQVALLAELFSTLPLIQADREMILRMVLNLVHNAIKFTPSGGKIIVSTEMNEGSVVVHVSDTGIGIPDDDLSHVFERFYKADKARSGSGTGLGLAIAMHIVEAHGGRIWVESVEGRGSTFSFALPLKAPGKKITQI